MSLKLPHRRAEVDILAHASFHRMSVPPYRAEVEEAVAKLEYGLVAVNAWSGLGFANEVPFPPPMSLSYSPISSPLTCLHSPEPLLCLM
jgi:hypothetical protein